MVDMVSFTPLSSWSMKVPNAQVAEKKTERFSPKWFCEDVNNLILGSDKHRLNFFGFHSFSNKKKQSISTFLVLREKSDCWQYV